MSFHNDIFLRLRIKCLRYYGNQIQKTDYNLDTEELKKYFPLGTVVDGMLDIYQRLLGLKFTKIGKQTPYSPLVVNLISPRKPRGLA